MDGERSVKENQMRLSDLDDFLLCKILSGFPTKESVRTSVLSKRWRNLWLNVPALDLDSSDFSDDDVVMGSSTILETLISSCPALEALTIFRGANDNLIDVCVRSQSLKTFELDCLRWTSEGHAVQIDAPRLESMTLSDHLSHSFIIRTYELMFSFILCLHRLFMITVKWNSYLSYPTCLSCMLASKKLHGRCCQPFLRVAQIYALSSWLVDLSSVPQCLQSSLEVLELETPYILREGRSTHGTSSKMKLAKYFLENCGALKELIVSRNFFYLIDKIMSIPRRSTGCEFFSF
ncbi:BnaC05g12930D [Brassica napus]|uniref:BnaC05g12930D protein n=1 Tax=Brassica napus TaxID=3708 RepID=A0A078HQE3_BRANA|nr:BnaC05g12930D [Brassica napus]